MKEIIERREKLEKEIESLIYEFQHENRILVEKIYVHVGSPFDEVEVKIQLMMPQQG